MEGNKNPTPPSVPGPGPSPDEDPCDITFAAQLISPDARVVSSLTVNQVLGVESRSATLRGKQVLSLSVTKDGERAGDIDDYRADAVLACLQKGKKFVAVVTTLNLGLCAVRIQRA